MKKAKRVLVVFLTLVSGCSLKKSADEELIPIIGGKSEEPVLDKAESVIDNSPGDLTPKTSVPTSINVPGTEASTTVPTTIVATTTIPKTTTIVATTTIPKTTTTVATTTTTTILKTTTTVATTTTTIATRTPGAPQYLTNLVVGSDTTLFWNPPIDNGGSTITDYVIDYWAKGGSFWTRIDDGKTASTSTSIKSLPSNIYSFRVAAVNASGIGSFVQTGDVNVGITTTTTTTTVPSPSVAQVVSESFSTSALTLQGTQASENQVWWTVRVRDSQGRLASSVGGQLCPPGSNYPFGTFCTGATFGRNGTAYDATYQGLFWISPDAPSGDWIPRFDPIPNGVTVAGNVRLRVTARAATTTTVATAQTLTLDSDSLSKSSMILQSNIGDNSVYWTVRVRDPFGGRLSSNAVGARLCPVASPWPDGAGCTGATSTGQGHIYDMTYTFFFLISPNAPTGQWLGRIFGPVSGQPDIIGQSRISVTR